MSENAAAVDDDGLRLMKANEFSLEALSNERNQALLIDILNQRFVPSSRNMQGENSPLLCNMVFRLFLGMKKLLHHLV